MKLLKYGALLAIGVGLIFQAEARDYMNMKPKIVRESEIQSGATNVEAAQNNEQVVKILLTADDTAGGFSMFSDVFQKGSLVPLHAHNWHDEAFYVVSGRFEVVLGNKDKKEIVGPGTAIFVPRGTPHGFESLDDNCKFLVMYTPGGWEHYYRETLKLTPEQREDKDFMKQFKESYDNYALQQ